MDRTPKDRDLGFSNPNPPHSDWRVLLAKFKKLKKKSIDNVFST